MKFEQLFFLREAAKYGSISVAAEKNYISQSSVSHSILNLEKELGTTLLKRTNAGVAPTQLGEMVLLKIEDITQSLNEIVDITKEQRNSGEVNISCIPCICEWIIPQTLQQLKDNSMNVQLSVSTAESNTVVQNVSSGISEFGIIIRYDGLERISELKYTPLFRDEYWLYVGPKSPYWDKDSITYEQLLKEPYIAYRDEFKHYNGGLTNMISSSDIPNIIFRTDNLDSIKNMIAQNNYIAFFPKHMSANDIYLQSGHIRRIRISDRKLDFEVGYVESVKYKQKNIDKIVLGVIKDTIKDIIS
jgi:DNA-binding transcriptional LysR family regulator